MNQKDYNFLELARELGVESVAYDILEKKRIITHWEGKKGTAEYYIEQNQEKIKKLKEKLPKEFEKLG